MKPLFFAPKYTHIKKGLHHCSPFSVGIPGFEPGTPCSQSRCANRTALHPVLLVWAMILCYHVTPPITICKSSDFVGQR